MSDYEKLLRYWQNYNSEIKGFHEDDKCEYLTRNSIHMLSYKDYISKYKGKDKQYECHFHSGLLPGPYTGNLKDAKIYLIYINPSFDESDYKFEATPEFNNAMIKNLKQESMEYPFFPLNPNFTKYYEEYCNGKNYWTKKLNPLITQLQSRYQTKNEVLKYISNVVCDLELIPYHSKLFKNDRDLNKLKSLQLTCNYIRQLIDDENKLTIITRKVKDISRIIEIDLLSLNKDNVIVFSPKTEARAASLKKYTDKIIHYLDKENK